MPHITFKSFYSRQLAKTNPTTKPTAVPTEAGNIQLLFFSRNAFIEISNCLCISVFLISKAWTLLKYSKLDLAYSLKVKY